MKGQEAFLLFKKGHLVFKKPDDLFPCNKILFILPCSIPVKSDSPAHHTRILLHPKRQD